MIAAMRDVASQYYESEQVENGAADGTYIESDCASHLCNELDIEPDSNWVAMQ